MLSKTRSPNLSERFNPGTLGDASVISFAERGYRRRASIASTVEFRMAQCSAMPLSRAPSGLYRHLPVKFIPIR